MKRFALLSCVLAIAVSANSNDDKTILKLEDVFNLEYASDLEMTDDGDKIYFVRHFMDIQTDRQLSNIWSVSSDGNALQAVTSGHVVDRSPTLSPNGDRLAYISTESGKPQIHMRWLQSGASAKLTNLTEGPSDLNWSPDGKYIAFNMFVRSKVDTPVSLPGKPEDAEWAKSAVYINDVHYRFDGAGYIKPGYTHIFVIPAEGGSPRQITSGDYNHDGGISWSRDSKAIYFSANRHDDFRLEPLNSDIYRVYLDNGDITALSDRYGPDNDPKLAPNGKLIAFTGYDDLHTNYENNRLYIMDVDGSDVRTLTADLDRGVGTIQWAANSSGIYFQYNDKGHTKVAYQPLKGKRREVARDLGGMSLGRPYTDASFDVANNGAVAYTLSKPQRPADVAIVNNKNMRTLTDLNRDALDHKTLGQVEPIKYSSAAGLLEIEGWIVYPPNFNPNKKYPLILEIHGGPVAAYGPHFSAEIQLFAAAGNVVLYTNPRGSESYGREFAHTIHHNYPGEDYNDLMSGVDAMLAKGFIDEKRLYVTGGSGGGVLTSWIIGHTDRFAAAVVAKPVINWYSFVLTADYYPFFAKYWFEKLPWEDQQEYMRRSPISYVGNVTTPTMLLTGEVDYRTPISETEQFYQALQLRRVKSALVRIPEASHGIYKRPSQLMSKVAHILWWFEQNGPNKSE